MMKFLARCFIVGDFNNRNKRVTAKLLGQDYQYYNLHKSDEYDMEMRQSHIAGKPIAGRNRDIHLKARIEFK